MTKPRLAGFLVALIVPTIAHGGMGAVFLVGFYAGALVMLAAWGLDEYLLKGD